MLYTREENSEESAAGGSIHDGRWSPCSTGISEVCDENGTIGRTIGGSACVEQAGKGRDSPSTGKDRTAQAGRASASEARTGTEACQPLAGDAGGRAQSGDHGRSPRQEAWRRSRGRCVHNWPRGRALGESLGRRPVQRQL